MSTHPLAVLNTAIATTPGDYEVRALSLHEARALVVTALEILSAVGHQATAQVLSDLLGREIPVNRIQFAQQPGQSALVLKLRGRIPEAASPRAPSSMSRAWRRSATTCG